MSYLARVSECVHGYVSCTFGDCPGGTTTKFEPDLAEWFESALFTDGAHHKQWYLEEIATLLGVELSGDYDEGIAP